MKSGRGADVRCITLEFKGMLVLAEGICLVLKQPGVVARNGFNERVLSDPLKIQEQVINIKTGPTSAISIALYPSFEEAEKI